MRTLFSALASWLVVSLLAVGPAALIAAENEPRPQGNTPIVDDQPLKPHEVRNTVRLILRREATAETDKQRAAAIRDLCKMYVAVCRDEELAQRSRLKLKAKMYSRLVSVKKDLEWDIRRRREDTKKRSSQTPGNGSLAGASDEETILLLGQEARGGAAVRDYGETLVELIQRTISPEHWDVNGGPGSIVYYPNLKVLVVRASGEVHGRVGGLFDGLRAAP